MKVTIRNSMKKVFLSSLLLFTITFASHAQEVLSSDTLSVELSEIEIEATHSSISIERAPLSVSYLNRSDADRVSRPGETLNELTFTLPGVWISDRENHALGERMTIRGMGWRSQFGVRGIQVILDDIPLTVADGQTVMNMVDPAMIQSLELLRGPSATFWGNSSGGVLYMRTRPSTDAPRLTYRGYLGSFNTIKQELQWHDQINGVRWNAYGSYYDTEGFRDYSAAQLIRSGVSASFDIGANSSFEGRLSYAGMPFAEHPGSLPKEDAKNEPDKAWPFNVNTQSGKEYHQIMGSTRFMHSFENGLLSVLGHGTYRDLTNPLPGPYITVDRLAGGVRTNYDIYNLPYNLQIGGELKWQHDDRQQRNNEGGTPGNDLVINQTDNVESQALFAKSIFEFNRLSLSLGLRGDRMVFKVDDYIESNNSTRTFATINPSIGANYNFGATNFFSNFSTSFESPTTTEFKNRLGSNGNIQPGFNPNLNPEKTIGFEAGFRGRENNLNIDYDITGFLLLVTDQIIQETEIDGQAIFSNGGDAQHHGVEAHISFQPSRFVAMQLMYTWIHAEFSGGEYDLGEEFKGHKLPGVAPHRFSSNLSLYLKNHTLSTDVEWVDKYFADSENTAVNDSYLLINGRWTFSGIDFSGWKIKPFIAINNVFNTRYNTSIAINNNFGRYFEPGSNRSFRGGFSVDIY